MNFSIKTRQLLGFIFLSLGIYALIIIVFAYIYYTTKSIAQPAYLNPRSNIIDFPKAIYFSIVSFHTIGFGDIQPITNQGRTFVIIQSTISLFFTAIFSGFLVYFVIKRPRDIFVTHHLYIRHRNNKYWLSLRIGNKGRTIIDVGSKFEAWTIVNNTRVRIFRSKMELADLERILYFDLDLDDLKNHHLRKALDDVFHKHMQLHMKFAFIGNDVRSGEQVAFAKYYDSGDLRFGTIFQNVYSWDVNGRRKDFKWKNFERIDVMEEPLVSLFKQQANP